MLDKLAPERFWDFGGSTFRMQRLDYPLHQLVAAIQSRPLNHLYDGMLLNRMLDIELRTGNGGDPLTLPEMFREVREAIWLEVAAGKDVNSFRRALQRAHLAKLIGLVVNPGASVPEDASTLARADLKQLQAQIRTALASQLLDAYNRAHLDETVARIDAALEAGIQRQLGLRRP